MEISYYNLSGGINLSSTKTELGMDTKRIYWADSENVEILENKGVIKQKGNTLFLQLPKSEAITGVFEMPADNQHRLIITTESGKIYIYDDMSYILTTLEKTIKGKKPHFVKFLNGTLVITESDGLFYIKNNETYEVVECGLKNSFGNPVTGSVVCVYRGRVWVASESTIYYSALGTYDDFLTENDAGYISDFHTDTDEITALKPYKDYLAIYKKNKVYLLTGVSPDDFSIVPFADKGSVSPNAISNVENKQYFLSNGIFALEQVGELNQLQIGSEISLKIKPEFANFDRVALKNAIMLHYEAKSQIWCFFPYANDEYYHTIWINDYVNKAWYKRVIPQNITCACIFNDYVITASNDGNIYKEDFGTTFDGKPIKFMWKSAFLALGDAHKRKMVDEFYFLLDETYDNDFNLSVYKDYDSEFSDDIEHIYSTHLEHLIWANDENVSSNIVTKLPDFWPDEDDEFPVWPINRDVMEKAELSEANYSVQLCVSGTEIVESCAIIGLQFREIYNDEN